MSRLRWLFLAPIVAIGSGAGTLAARQVTANPHGTLPEGMDCSACHTTEGWLPVRDTLAFAHGAVSGFVLSGAHTQVACAGCHLDLRYDAPDVKADDCAGCHLDVHEGRMAQDCTACHDTRSFRAVDGESIHARTTFPLTGAHRQVTCESCHVSDVGGAFTALPTDCVSCHRSDFQGARTVDHVAGGYPTTCTECHSTVGWSDAPAFDHAGASGGFALVGAHAGLQCAHCHRTPGMEPIFTAASQDDCVACHQADYDGEHAGSGFPTTCVSCHASDRWEGATFDHGTTSFPLEGAHAPAPCASCHGPPGHLAERPSGPQDCVACHQSDYDDEHGGSAFPTTCLECHTQSSWEGATFDHASLSRGFALEGPHQAASCTACHALPDYTLLFPVPSGDDDCVSCHQAEYDGEHAGSGFPTTCVSCHASDRWEGATFDHGTTSFPLEGAHAPAACASCHGPPGHLAELPSGPQDCVACHRSDYEGEHAGSGFPTTCLECHTQTSWEGASIDHVAVSGGFALEGPHATASCTACHALPDYTLLFPEPSGSDDCVSCHQAEYDGEHAGSGFPTTCLTCHQPDTWAGATLDHPSISGGFQLLGAHTTAPCAACHSIPGYGLLFPDPADQNDCIACHQTDYDGEHGGSGFPTDCSMCHGMNAWEPATFDHDSQFFPIYSGPHREKWSSCSDCHLGGDVSDFTCTTCHTRGDTDDDHTEVSGYVYESHACFSCHPRGRSD